jgi:hypothetical protein
MAHEMLTNSVIRVDGKKDALGSPGLGLRWTEHLPLLVAGAVTTLTALRLVRVSHFNAETALAVLSLSGTANVLLSVLLQTLPTFIAGAGVGLFVAARERGFKVHDLVVTAVLLAFLLVPWQVLLGVLALGVLDWLVNGRRGRRAVEQGRPAPVGADRPVVYGFLLMMILLLPNAMWLPMEAVSVDGKKPTVGYVLHSGGDGLVLLRDDNREVVRLGQSGELERTYCETDDEGWTWDGASVLSLFMSEDQPRYPDCGNVGAKVD